MALGMILPWCGMPDDAGRRGVARIYPNDTAGERAAIMRGLRVMFPNVPDTTLAERLAAAILSTSI